VLQENQEVRGRFSLLRSLRRVAFSRNNIRNSGELQNGLRGEKMVTDVWQEGVTSMTIKVTALIRKETKIDPRKPNDKPSYASLTLLNAEGKEYGVPRLFSGFPEVGDLLKREAGATHDQLQDRLARYDRGDEVQISLSLTDEASISNLGFDPKAA
jgi:hypothetical protein